MKTQSDVYDVCRLYVLDYRSTIGDDLSDKIMGLVRSRDLTRLASLSTCDFVDVQYVDVDCYRCLRQIEAFFKKNALFSSEACTLAAEKSFSRAERICRITNKRLDFYYAQQDRLDPDLRLWMSRAKRYVSRLLGNYDTFLAQIPELIKITSGASATRSRAESMRPFKISKRPFATPAAEPYLKALATYFGYGPLKIRPTVRNRVEVVPKNFQTHRTIACEPEGNLCLQLAFDEYAKFKLRESGQDLRSQVRNQCLAMQGSLYGDLATIDLSMASDTLAYNAVAWLLPYPWFQYLTDVRTPLYKGAFGEGQYAKFSSMGNGATFTLETLIFCSCAYAVGSKAFSVYGDDIIIETELAQDLIRMLKFIGFSVNTDKSFIDGPFRESCGKDYWNGTLVTPVYLRDGGKAKTVLSHNVNTLASIATPYGKLAEYLRDFIVAERLQLVPFTESSIEGVWVDIHTAYEQHLFKWKHSRLWRTCYVPVLNKQEHITIVNSRALFLWYLSKYQEEKSRNKPRLDATVTTGYSPLRLKYRRKVRPWYPPGLATPVHLYWWAEYLVRG